MDVKVVAYADALVAVNTTVQLANALFVLKILSSCDEEDCHGIHPKLEVCALWWTGGGGRLASWRASRAHGKVVHAQCKKVLSRY
jgi:hypothetical protein